MINHKLFNCIEASYRDRIVSSVKELSLVKGENLFFEDFNADYVYYIKKGHIKVYKTSIEGSETIFEVYNPSMFVALGVLFREPKKYPASGKSVENSIVYSINVSLLEEAIISSPTSSKVWLSHMNHRLTEVQRMMSDLIFADSMTRLKKIIKYFYKNYSSKTEGKYIRIQIPITKQEMAELLNVRRETLSRMLSSLKDSNVCEAHYKELIVNKDWIQSTD